MLDFLKDGGSWKPFRRSSHLGECPGLFKAYKRKEMKVNLLEGEDIQCQVYVAIPTGNYKPDKAYLEILIKAAKQAELPDDYVAALHGYLELEN